MKAAIIGGGVIGGGWAARFLLNGWTVDVVDPAPGAEAAVDAVLARARRSLPMLYDRSLPHEGALRFVGSLAEAVADADWVQESVPERLDLKLAVLRQVSALAPAHAVIGSSTSGLSPPDLNPEGARVIVTRPADPLYLLPLVELAGRGTDRAAEILRGLGLYPLVLAAEETGGQVASRLQGAVWREALALIRDGTATTEQIDAAIRMGFGLCWAQT
ncbi:MAG: 3-hydroxyacyl-CoA dehydrogenase NAD-binding domain-containing protein, partial [Jannaschia sp.]